MPLLVPAEQKMMDLIKPICDSASDNENRILTDDPLHILIVGLGSGALPMYSLQNCRVYVSKGIKIETVEADPRLIKLAIGLFGYSSVPDLSTIEQMDLGLAVQKRTNQTIKYDIVLVNAFDAKGAPETCRNPNFFTNVKTILRPDGRVLQSLRSPQYEDAIVEYQKTFGGQQVVSHKAEDGEWVVVAMGPKANLKSGAAHAMSLCSALLAIFTVAL